MEIAVALGLAPKVLLLDEPAAGVPSSLDRGRVVFKGRSGDLLDAPEHLEALMGVARGARL